MEKAGVTKERPVVAGKINRMEKSDVGWAHYRFGMWIAQFAAAKAQTSSPGASVVLRARRGIRNRRIDRVYWSNGEIKIFIRSVI